MSKRGFTLIELMVAVTIILITVSGALLSFMYLLVLNDSSRNLMIAVNDAQYVLEQIKSQPYANIASYTPPTFTNLTGETISLTRSIGVNISTVNVDVGWQDKQGTRSFSLATSIAK
jgi:prepilin-type N-terminal cleavage/methylation domain-containing protein